MVFRPILLPSRPRVFPLRLLANAARSFLELRFIYAILNDLEVEIISRQGTLRDHFPARTSIQLSDGKGEDGVVSKPRGIVVSQRRAEVSVVLSAILLTLDEARSRHVFPSYEEFQFHVLTVENLYIFIMSLSFFFLYLFFFVFARDDRAGALCRKRIAPIDVTVN